MKELKIPKSVTDRSDLCLKMYLKDISKYPLLEPDEEIEIAHKAKKGDKQALDKLVTSNLRFVVSVAKQYQNSSLQLMDIINEGNSGLIKAAQLYDPDRGVKFISYAVWWIRQAIFDAMNNKAKMIRVPLNQNLLISKVNKTITYFEQQFDRFPSIPEIAEHADLTEDKVIEVMSYMTKTVSADTPFTDAEDSGCLYDLLPGSESVEKHLMDESNKIDLNGILNNLSEREYDIIQMTFGLNGVQELPFDEIGKRFNMTGERIRQIKESCLEKLKNNHSKELKQLYD